MSRRFRICMAKGGRESARPSYGRSKLTLISREKITLGSVAKSWAVTILTLEQNPPERIFLIYIKKFSREDFALKSKLWPPKFLEHRPIFAGNSRSTGISQLQAGKTRSKRPRSHWLSTVHLLPYMWASFYPLDPSRYLSSFSSWRPKTKKFPFFTKFHCRSRFFFAGLLRTQFWCHRPSQ